MLLLSETLATMIPYKGKSDWQGNCLPAKRVYFTSDNIQQFLRSVLGASFTQRGELKQQ